MEHLQKQNLPIVCCSSICYDWLLSVSHHLNKVIMLFLDTWKSVIKLLRSDEVRQITITEPWWYPGIAVITGVLAAISGVIYVRTASLGNEAVYYSNQAVLAQSQASDSWAEYEADSCKAKTVDTGFLLTNDAKVKEELKKQGEEYRKKQLPLKSKAMQFEGIRDLHLKVTDKKVKSRDAMSIAGVIIQLGIGLASVAAMTKRHSIFLMTIVVTAIGLGITAFIFLHL